MSQLTAERADPKSAMARLHMVDSQVRPNGVTNEALAQAMLALPREIFLPPDQRPLAYMEARLPLGAGRYLTEPMVLAKLLQAAEITKDDKVLVIGAGTGYAVALVAKLAGDVVGVESEADLSAAATANLCGLGVTNATILHQPLGNGALGHAPFSCIIIDGAVELVPQALVDQLADGGRLLAVVMADGRAQAQRFTRAGASVGHYPVFDARIAALPGFEKPKGFAF
jgi:protein-L-isoaspartate(D-aspartate) O-methyltransferase